MKFLTNYDFYTAPRANVLASFKKAQHIKKTFKLFNYIVEKNSYLLIVKPCISGYLNSSELYSEADKVSASSFTIQLWVFFIIL